MRMAGAIPRWRLGGLLDLGGRHSFAGATAVIRIGASRGNGVPFFALILKLADENYS